MCDSSRCPEDSNHIARGAALILSIAEEPELTNGPAEAGDKGRTRVERSVLMRKWMMLLDALVVVCEVKRKGICWQIKTCIDSPADAPCDGS